MYKVSVAFFFSFQKKQKMVTNIDIMMKQPGKTVSENCPNIKAFELGEEHISPQDSGAHNKRL